MLIQFLQWNHRYIVAYLRSIKIGFVAESDLHSGRLSLIENNLAWSRKLKRVMDRRNTHGLVPYVELRLPSTILEDF